MRVDIEQWGSIFGENFIVLVPKVQEFPTSVGYKLLYMYMYTKLLENFGITCKKNLINECVLHVHVHVHMQSWK